MTPQVPTVTKEEVLNDLESGTAVVVDVLARHAYEKVHIKGAISIPFDMLEKGNLDVLGEQKNIIVYCKNYTCLASGRAARILRDFGYNASAYEGGIEEWLESGFPTEGRSASE